MLNVFEMVHSVPRLRLIHRTRPLFFKTQQRMTGYIMIEELMIFSDKINQNMVRHFYLVKFKGMI